MFAATLEQLDVTLMLRGRVFTPSEVKRVLMPRRVLSERRGKSREIYVGEVQFRDDRPPIVVQYDTRQACEELRTAYASWVAYKTRVEELRDSR
jgi:hypothetical protein